MHRVNLKSLSLCIFLLLFFAIWTLRATVFYQIDMSIGDATARTFYSTLLKCVLWVVPAIFFAYYVRRTSPMPFLGLSIFPRLTDWCDCLLVICFFLSVVAILEIAIGGKSLSGDVLKSPYHILFLQLIVSPFVEEVVFRGLVLKELLEVFTVRLASILTSLLFVLIHWPYWLFHQGMNADVVTNSIGILIFSLVACWLYSRTESIWPPTVAHIANNLLSSLITAQPVP